MPDIGMMEMLVIGIVALIVVGPKDLPKMFRKLGQFTGRMRGMAKEFSNAMNAAADETGMSQMNRDLRTAAKYTNPVKAAKDAAKDAMGDVMDDIDPTKFEEGSATRAIAEKKAAAQKATRERIEAMKAGGAAEMSDEPEEEPEEPTFVADADAPEGPVRVIEPADPGPAKVEPAAQTERS
jgi:sec-independent protein translocase protein TatB